MPENDESALSGIKGLTNMDPAELARLQKVMMDEVIPEILKAVEERQLRAAESRDWPLKC